jgi:hypothetical protein
MHIFHLVLLHLASYLRLQWFLDRVGDSTRYYSTSIWTKMESIKICVDKLLFLMRWILAHGEIAILQAEDLSIYIQRRHQFHPIEHRRLVDISEQDCYMWFSQNHENMQHLMIHLCIPNTITHPLDGAVFTGEECFLMWLYHMTKGVPFTKMACFVFGGDLRRRSEINEEFISYAYNKFNNKISGTSLSQWISNKLDSCRDLICSSILRGAIKEIELADGNVFDWQWIRHHFEFESFHVAKEDAAAPPNVGANKEDTATPPKVGANKEDAAALPNIGADKEDAAAPAAPPKVGTRKMLPPRSTLEPTRKMPQPQQRCLILLALYFVG